MFKDTLFSIISETQSDLQADFTIQLNRSHPVYSGHFPTDAITPGICIIQIAVDLFSHIQNQEYFLIQAKNVKFLQIIRPDEYGVVEYRLSWEPIDNGSYFVKVVVVHNEIVFSKMSIILSTIS